MRSMSSIAAAVSRYLDVCTDVRAQLLGSGSQVSVDEIKLVCAVHPKFTGHSLSLVAWNV